MIRLCHLAGGVSYALDVDLSDYDSLRDDAEVCSGVEHYPFGETLVQWPFQSLRQAHLPCLSQRLAWVVPLI